MLALHSTVQTVTAIAAGSQGRSLWDGDQGELIRNIYCEYILDHPLLAHRTAEFPWLISPLEAIQARARKDHTTVSWLLDDFNLNAAGNSAQFKDVAIVFLNSDSGEGM